MGAKHDPVPKNTFLERLFKPSVVWQDDNKGAGPISVEEVVPPINELDDQIIGEFDAKNPNMAAYRDAVLKISARFEGLEFHHVARDNNQATDILARLGAKRDPVPKNTFLEWLFKPSMVWQDDHMGADLTSANEVLPPIN